MSIKKYHIGDALSKPAAHHESFEKLWETKWKAPCKMGVYPFMFGCIQDFEPVAQAIIAKGLREPYDWDEYAEMFFPKAEELANIAAEAERANQKEKASEYYLRSSTLYRIARFPIPRSPKQHLAWTKNKEVFYRGAALLPTPIHPLTIPHTHRLPHEGATIQANLLLPSPSLSPNPSSTNTPAVPLLILLTGLDGYRTDLAVWQPLFATLPKPGIATLVLEIPGTGDSPADAQDPTSAERVWSSVLDWADSQSQGLGQCEGGTGGSEGCVIDGDDGGVLNRGVRIDKEKVVIWGFSTGGYYALRAAHTHGERLKGVVSLGGGCHFMFEEGWLNSVDNGEYPFELRGALAEKFGYGSNKEGVEEFVKEAMGRFSLMEDGTLERGVRGECEVLLVNGEGDEIFPIEDLWVALEHGTPKTTRVVKGRKHMGEPESFVLVLKWIYRLLEAEGDVMELLRAMPSRVKY